MNIQLIPGTVKDRSVKTKLIRTIRIAESLRGCVAFWVIDTNYFGIEFTKLIGKPNSFYCIDINKPTNLDFIQEHYLKGATNLYLHLYKAGSSRDFPSLPNHLLHAKIILFDLPDQKAEIWIGSHNLTKRALSGPNKEASIVISCSQQDEIYCQVEAYLQEVKEACDLYKPDLLSYYKSLQSWQTDPENLGEIVSIMRLLGNDIARYNNNTILLLGDNEQDYKALAKINNQLIVNVLDIQNTNRELLFSATVQSSGLISKSNPKSYELEFSSRPIAIRKHPLIPYQGWREQAFGYDELKSFKYWANIVIGEPIVDGRIEPVKPKKEKLWYKDKHESEQVNQDKSSLFDSALWEKIVNPSIHIEEETVVYKATLPGRYKSDQTVDQLFLQDSNSLNSALNRTNRVKVLQYFKENVDTPYFNSEQAPNFNLPELPIGDFRNAKILKEFIDQKLGKKMRLIRTDEKAI